MTTRSTDVATIDHTPPGLMPDAEAERALASFRITDLDGQRVIDRMPTPQERSVMQRRMQVLHSTLRPISHSMTDKDAAVRALSTMFVGFPSMRNANASELIAAYLLHLQELPLFAVQRACRDIGRHVIKDLDPDFPPTSPRVYEVAEKYMSATYVEKLQFERVLSMTKQNLLPPPASPKQAEKMHTLLSELAADLKAKNDKLMTEEREERARRALEANEREINREYARRGEQPVISGGILISPQLQQLMREKQEEIR